MLLCFVVSIFSTGINSMLQNDINIDKEGFRHYFDKEIDEENLIAIVQYIKFTKKGPSLSINTVNIKVDVGSKQNFQKGYIYDIKINKFRNPLKDLNFVFGFKDKLNNFHPINGIYSLKENIITLNKNYTAKYVDGNWIIGNTKIFPKENKRFDTGIANFFNTEANLNTNNTDTDKSKVDKDTNHSKTNRDADSNLTYTESFSNLNTLSSDSDTSDKDTSSSRGSYMFSETNDPGQKNNNLRKDRYIESSCYRSYTDSNVEIGFVEEIFNNHNENNVFLYDGISHSTYNHSYLDPMLGSPVGNWKVSSDDDVNSKQEDSRRENEKNSEDDKDKNDEKLKDDEDKNLENKQNQNYRKLEVDKDKSNKKLEDDKDKENKRPSITKIIVIAIVSLLVIGVILFLIKYLF